MAADDPKYQCGCGSRHVRQGAVILAWIIIGISLIAFVGSWFLVRWYNAFPLFITIAICGLVIYGDKQEKSWMFLPFLILEGIEIIGYFLLAIFYIVYAIVLPSNDYDILSTNVKLTRNEYRVILIVIAIILFLFLTLYSYAWIVIFRAYQFIRDEIEATRFGVRTMVYSQPEVGYPQVVYQSHPPQHIQPPQPPPLYEQQTNYGAYENQEVVVQQNSHIQHMYDDPSNLDSFESPQPYGQVQEKLHG
uniref:Uncharacterized protein n=2 Tax=Acrobeloides nanus TaxID=290746 RepID=A0A914E4Z9_9BILA